MINMMTLTLQSSTFLSMQFYTTFTCLWCVHLPVHSICKSMFSVWELFKARPITNKNMMLLGYNEYRLMLSFGKFYGRNDDFVSDYKLSLATMLNSLFHTLCHSVVSILTTCNPIYLISNKSAWWVWPVSRGSLLFHGTWSYLLFCWRACCPTLYFVYGFLIMITFNILLTS
jgi:hypothetical protein